MIPRQSTPRRDRPTTGGRVAAFARALGRPLMPWQVHVADVAGEQVDGVHAYSTVVLSVPRRAGKSLLVLARMFATAAGGPARFVWYTAQDGTNVTKLWRQQWAPMVRDSPLGPAVQARASEGRESFELVARRSFVTAFAPVPTSLHSQAGDLIVFDEAWAFTRERGRDLEVAAEPTMATRPGAQMWIVSAAGDITSTWWQHWLETGALAADVDLGHGIAFFDYGARPGDDPADPATWRTAHPALCTEQNPVGTIAESFLAGRFDRDPAMFARAYLNIPDRTGADTAPIDVATWEALTVDAPEPGRVAVGVDVAPDQTAAAVVAAHHHHGLVVLEVVDHRPGHDWVPGRIIDLYDRWDVAAVALDAAGQSPAAVLRRPLEQAGIPLRPLQLADVTAAAADLVAAVRTGAIRHVPHPGLDAAVAGCRRRLIGDGSWAWGRRDADVDVSPLVAATFARWAHPELHDQAPPAIA